MYALWAGLSVPSKKLPNSLRVGQLQAKPPPDFPHGMHALIAPPGQGRHAKPERFVRTQIGLDGGHALGREHFVQIGQEIVVGIGLRGCHWRDDTREMGCLPHA